MAFEKNQARINPLATPKAYGDHFDGHIDEMEIAYQGGHKGRFEFYKEYNDHRTGFYASSMIDRETGHTILFFKGMDMPGRNEGAGMMGFMKDIKAIFQLKDGKITGQVAAAEQAYLDLMNDPEVKDIEIAGYSVGSQYLNYLSAKYGAKGTAIADMGMSDQLLETVRKENEAEGRKFHGGDMKKNIFSLNLDADVLPKMYAAGPVRGTTIDLDGNYGKNMVKAVTAEVHTLKSLKDFAGHAFDLDAKGALSSLFEAMGYKTRATKAELSGMADLATDFTDAVFEPLAAMHIPQVYALHAWKFDGNEAMPVPEHPPAVPGSPLRQP